jgi:hypothetical protein
MTADNNLLDQRQAEAAAGGCRRKMGREEIGQTLVGHASSRILNFKHDQVAIDLEP